MKKIYNHPKLQVFQLEQSVNICAGTNGIAITGSETKDAVTGNEVNTPPINPTPGDGDDEEVAAKPWTPLDE